MDTHFAASQLPQTPVMARQKFAELVGVSEATVKGWINKGYVPVVEVGKYRLINLALLTKHALDQEFTL